MGFLACDFMAAGGSRRRKNGHSVPLCNLGDHPWICWTHEGLVPDPFVVGASGKVQCFFRLQADAGTETKGGGVWQRITVYVLVRLAGVYGTVQMLESRGYGIAPRFRSIAAYKRWSPIPPRRIPFSQVA